MRKIHVMMRRIVYRDQVQGKSLTFTQQHLALLNPIQKVKITICQCERERALGNYSFFYFYFQIQAQTLHLHSQQQMNSNEELTQHSLKQQNLKVNTVVELHPSMKHLTFIQCLEVAVEQQQESVQVLRSLQALELAVVEQVRQLLVLEPPQ